MKDVFRRMAFGVLLIWALVTGAVIWWEENRRPPALLDADVSVAVSLASQAQGWSAVDRRRELFAQLIANAQPFSAQVLAPNGEILERHPAENWPVPPNALLLQFPLTLAEGEGVLRIALPQRAEPRAALWWPWLVMGALGTPLVLWWIWRVQAGQRRADAAAEKVLAGERDPDAFNRHSNHPVTMALRVLLHENREYAQAQVHAIDSARRRSFIDGDTELGNRAYFDAHLEVQLRDRDHHAHGVLMLLEIGEVFASESAEQLALLRHVATHLRAHTREFPEAVVARRAIGSFALYVPAMLLRDAENFARHVLRDIRASAEQAGVNSEDRLAHLGAVEYRAGDDQYKLMAEADMAVRSAQQEGLAIGWHVFSEGELSPENIMGRVRWRALLETVIEHRSVQLHYLPVFSNSENTPSHYEILSRVPGENGALFTAATFIPMAHRVGLAAAFDRMVCDKVMKALLFGPAPAAPLFVNLSVDALSDAAFRQWLVEHLAENRHLAEKLVFEINESVASHLDGAQQNFLEGLRQCGALLSVEHVGHPQYSARYLKPGLFSFVKLHRSLTRDIETDAAHQDFVRGLTAVALAAGAQPLAECVENAEQWQMLQKLGVQGGQGRYLGEALAQMPVAANA